MAEAMIIAGIAILFVLAAAELICIFTVENEECEESLSERMFTVMLYRKEDESFCSTLKAFLRERFWQEDIYFNTVYVVNVDVPEEMASEVKEICESRRDLVYITAKELLIKIECS